jgi:hypothetical protein
MASKEVHDRLRDGEEVTRAAETHADAVGDRLTDMLQPYARRGDEIPDVGTAMALLGRRLRALGEAMRAADRANEGEVADAASSAADRAEALARRAAAIAEYDAAFQDTAQLVSVLLRAVGEGALSMRVRPSSSRPGRVAEVEEGTEEGAERQPRSERKTRA